jgi:ParB-like chromosome segregation protein Spo0J
MPRRRAGTSEQGGDAAGRTGEIQDIPIGDVHDSWTPERTDELPLTAAVALILAVGVVDPILLRPRDEGGYLVVTGHRTVAAARLAGVGTVPAVVRQMDEAQALVALTLDGTATGVLTPAGAAELRARLVVAEVGDEETVDELLASMPIAAAGETEVEAETEAAAEGEAELATEAAAGPAEAAPSASPPPPAERRRRPPRARAGRPAGRASIPEATKARWVPLPAGAPRLARLSSAFADAPRMLRVLSTDGFTGTCELVGPDRREDVLAFLDGRLIAISVEQAGRRSFAPLRLPSPDTQPTVEMTVRPHPAAVVVALALALRSPARLVGLHASFVDLGALVSYLVREGGDAACVVNAPGGAGVILVAGGRPIAAYARRQGEEPSEAAETTDVDGVADLLAAGEGEVDVHSGPLPEPLDLEEVISQARAVAAT